MKRHTDILNKVIPASILALFLLIVWRFLVEPFLFPVNIDDCLYSALLQDHSIWELTKMLSGKYNGAYIAHFDGRVFSNFYSLIVFSILKTHTSTYYLYDLFIFFALLGSLYFFIGRLGTIGVLSPSTTGKKILFSLITGSCFYILLLDGRYEVFYWISGISNHLLSIIFFIFALTLFISKQTFLNRLILATLAFCFGQMNEVYALCFLLIFALIALRFSTTRITLGLMAITLGLSLYMNLSAHGTAVRFNTLYSISTHFNFWSSWKDMADTFWLPIINYRYIPIKIPVVILFFLTVRNYLNIKIAVSEESLFLFNRMLLLTALASIFMHCYILGEICTYRGLLFYIFSLLYFTFLIASLHIKNPLKLFFR